jgi:hypothetical protein
MSTIKMVGKVVVAVVAIMVVGAAMPSAFASHRTTQEPVCTCHASLSFARPSLSFGSDGLQFIPRVNVSIRLRGDQDGPRHTVGVNYEGSTSYTSDDVAVPGGISFSGQKTLLSDASCNGRWNFKGMELTRETLSGLTNSLVGDNQELKGTAHLKTSIAGCGFEEDHRQLMFTVKEFGNLRIGGWRLVH